MKNVELVYFINSSIEMKPSALCSIYLMVEWLELEYRGTHKI